MKKLLNAVVALAVIAFATTSCGDDDGETSVAVTIDAPTEITLGAGFQQRISMSAAGSGLASASIDISQGGMSVLTDNVDLSGNEADLDFDFTINQTGTYDVTVTVTDAAGGEQTAMVNLTIACMPTADFVDANMVSVVAEAPSFTTGSMGLVGQLTDWGNSGIDDIAMTKIGESYCYCATVDPTGLASGGFKFRLDGIWERGEKTADCQEIDNRESTAAASDTLNLTIAEWRNSDTFGGGCPD